MGIRAETRDMVVRDYSSAAIVRFSCQQRAAVDRGKR